MRVAYVCADPGVPVFGSKGCSIHVQEIVRAFVQRGAEVELFVSRVGGAPPADLRNCVVHELSIPKGGDAHQRESEQVRWNQRLIHVLGQCGEFDLLYERHSIWSASGMSWARHQGVPSVLEVNAPLIDEQSLHRKLIQSHLASVLTGQAMRSADMVYAVSDQIVSYCWQFVPSHHPVHVIPNGVNTQRFTPNVAPADSFDGLTIGFVGSLKPWHGIDLLLQAFSKFCLLREFNPSHFKSCDRFRLVIVGNGPEFPKINEWVDQRFDLRDKIKLVGAVSPADVPSWMSAIDIAVAPYPQLEGFYFSPLKIFEYMASGRAIVSSRAGQIGDIVKHGEDGLLSTPGDTDQLTAALIRLAEDAPLRRRLAENARAKSLKHSWDHVLDRILNLVEDSSAATGKPALADEVQV